MREREREMKIGWSNFCQPRLGRELEEMINKKKIEKAAIQLQFAVTQREKGKTHEGNGTINMREREREREEKRKERKKRELGGVSQSVRQQAGRQAGRRRYLVELLLWGGVRGGCKQTRLNTKVAVEFFYNNNNNTPIIVVMNGS